MKLSLADMNPRLAGEWHPELNGGITPKDIGVDNADAYWWKCDRCGCIWQDTVASRYVYNTPCPDCGVMDPEKRAEFASRRKVYHKNDEHRIEIEKMIAMQNAQSEHNKVDTWDDDL